MERKTARMLLDLMFFKSMLVMRAPYVFFGRVYGILYRYLRAVSISVNFRMAMARTIKCGKRLEKLLGMVYTVSTEMKPNGFDK